MTFVSPCILPLIPVYFIYLAGSSEDGIEAGIEAAKVGIGASEDGISKPAKNHKLVFNSIGFVLGFTFVFIILGASATALGHFLDANRDLLRKVSGIIIVLFGLYFMGIIKISFLETTRRFDLKLKKLRFPGAILFGIVFGFSWTPCLGAFLGPALALAGNSESLWEGMGLLFVFSVGLGLPFIISAIVFDRVKNVFKKIQTHSRIIGIISGLLLIAAGVLVFTDSLKYMSF